MVSLRKKYPVQLDSPAADNGELPVSTPPSVRAAAEPAAPATEPPKSAEPPVATDPVHDAEQSALRQRLREMERAESLRHEAAQQHSAIETGPPEPQEPPTTEEIIAGAAVPEAAKQWLRQHPDYVTDPAKNAKLVKMHNVAEYQAGGEFTPAYFERMEALLGLKQEMRPANNSHYVESRPSPRPSAPPPSRQVAYSAPVHRSPPSMATGRPMGRPAPLTRDEIEIALSTKLPGDSDEAAIRRYEHHKQRMMKMKADGVISDGR